MNRILLVEDEPVNIQAVSGILKDQGYQVSVATSGAKALEVLTRVRPDLILLDVMMPVMDGYEFTDQLRKSGDNIPILMVTARQLPEEKCRGFLVGTDDYMVKPVNQEEMLLRIKALLRRAQIASERKLHIGKVTLDYNALTLTREGVSQTLPQKEFYLLYKLLSCPDQIFTRLELMDDIWGMDSETVQTTVNVHVTRLRKRCENFPEFEIVAIRGIGYKAVITDA